MKDYRISTAAVVFCHCYTPFPLELCVQKFFGLKSSCANASGFLFVLAQSSQWEPGMGISQVLHMRLHCGMPCLFWKERSHIFLIFVSF